jgi:adenylylsulfate kinase-like enzyme
MAKYPILQTFYASDTWRRFRLQIIAERGLICEHCHERVIHARELTLHHIIELTPDNVRDTSISLNPDNVLLIHERCHNKIHRHGAIKTERRVVIVYGPPMSGKTSFVKQNANNNDLVVDFDAIYYAMSTGMWYNKPNEIWPNVKAVHSLLLDQIKTRYGRWQTAWIIGGYPDHYKRETLRESLGAELVYIQASQEECIERLKKDPYRKDRASEWTGYINKWFDAYTE